MPDIDVSDVLADPAFVQSIVVTRRAETVDTHGRSVITESTINIIGAVQPGSVAPVNRTAEYEASRNNITVFTQTKLVDAVTAKQPDIVNWHGSKYLVAKCFPWSDYGVGYYAAECELVQAIRADA